LLGRTGKGTSGKNGGRSRCTSPHRQQHHKRLQTSVTHCDRISGRARKEERGKHSDRDR